MWKLIRKYWFKILISSVSISVILFTLSYFIVEETEKFSDIFLRIFSSAAFFFVTFIILTILFYWQKSYVTPKSRRSNFQKKPFTELLQNGFLLEEEFLVGYKDCFTVLLTYDSNPYMCIRIKILCDTGEERTLQRQKYLNSFLNQTKWWQNVTDFWTPYALVSELPYIHKFYRTITYSEVCQKIEELIFTVDHAELAPLPKNEYFDLSQE